VRLDAARRIACATVTAAREGWSDETATKKEHGGGFWSDGHSGIAIVRREVRDLGVVGGIETDARPEIHLVVDRQQAFRR
jgi:hypothetical protein